MCYVYLIEAQQPNGECTKIGIASDVRSRLKSLQTGSPWPLAIRYVYKTTDKMSAITAERELHRKFHAHKAIGEWFNLAADDIAQQSKRKFDYVPLEEQLFGTQSSPPEPINQMPEPKWALGLAARMVLLLWAIGALVLFVVLWTVLATRHGVFSQPAMMVELCADFAAVAVMVILYPYVFHRD